MVVGYVSPKIAPETAECGVERFQETWMSCEVKPQTAKLAAAIDFFSLKFTMFRIPNARAEVALFLFWQGEEAVCRSFSRSGQLDESRLEYRFSSLVEPNLGLSRTKNTAVRRFGNIGKRSRRV